MIKVDWLVCGKIAFDVLHNVVENDGTKYVNRVIGLRDAGVANDPYDELETFCRKHAIQLISEEAYSLETDAWRIAIGWPLLLPANSKTIVLHNSILPKFRGYAPLINSLIKGEHEIGVTAFIATGGMEDGPVVAQEKILIDYPVTIIDAMANVTPLFIKAVKTILKQLDQKGNLVFTEQDHYLASYCLWRDEKDYRVKWQRSADEIRRLIDAVGFPYRGAMAKLNGQRINIKSASVFGDVDIEIRTIGKVIFIIHDCPVVVCGEGLLKITEAYFIKTGLSIIPFLQINSRFN